MSSADAKWLRMEYELGVVGCEMVATGIRDRSRREVMLVFFGGIGAAERREKVDEVELKSPSAHGCCIAEGMMASLSVLG